MRLDDFNHTGFITQNHVYLDNIQSLHALSEYLNLFSRTSIDWFE
jgi:hypothetical protein